VTAEDEIRLEVENLDLRRLLAQAGIDAAEQRNIEDLQRIIVEELHHRVKNTLAMVMSITSQSLRAAESLEKGREVVSERLLALGRAHDLLLKGRWSSAPLAEILKNAIAPFNASGAERFFVEGPDVAVSPAAVLPLAMVLNELSTNALKYGALSNAIGRVLITALVDKSSDRLRLKWEEIGGPAVRAPTARGFGTRLIERSFAGHLNGVAQLTFASTGVVCVLEIPVVSLKG
jgi:two-component sensor histidine kinase